MVSLSGRGQKLNGGRSKKACVGLSGKMELAFKGKFAKNCR